MEEKDEAPAPEEGEDERLDAFNEELKELVDKYDIKWCKYWATTENKVMDGNIRVDLKSMEYIRNEILEYFVRQGKYDGMHSLANRCDDIDLDEEEVDEIYEEIIQGGD